MRSRYEQTSHLLVDDGRRRREWDCLSCAHCGAVLRKARFTVEGSWCGRCGDAICEPCATRMQAPGGVCLPAKKAIDDALDRQAHRGALFEALGLVAD